MKMLQITVVLLCLYNGSLALAASGGRMGGSSFSSASSGSSSSHSSISSWRSSTITYLPVSHSSSDSSPAPREAAEEVDPNASVVLMIFFVTVCVFCFLIAICCIVDLDTAKTSVLKLQVGSLDTGGSLQRDLNRIAESADTSTSKGFNYVLRHSLLSLLRHADYCISGYSSVDVKWSVEECEKRFNQLSVEERGKFDEETLVNVNNIRKKTETTHTNSSYRLLNQYIVVTIIIAASGVPQLPQIKSAAQLKKALQILGSIPSSNIMGAEVLWTPQKENDVLTEQEMLEDYPLLLPI